MILRDDVDVLVKIKKISDGLNWSSRIVDHESKRETSVSFLLRCLLHFVSSDHSL